MITNPHNFINYIYVIGEIKNKRPLIETVFLLWEYLVILVILVNEASSFCCMTMAADYLSVAADFSICPP